MRRAELRRRARAGIGERKRCVALCLACGWQGVVEYARPVERWKCPACGRREVVRDDEETQRSVLVQIKEGEA